MPTFRLALALCASAGLAGCVSTADEIPLRDGSPNPAPVAGYRVECVTSLVGYPIWSATTACRPAAPAARTVIRARG